MKIKKAVTLYSLDIPVQQSSSSFFGNTNSETLYFKSKEEAESYQKVFYPRESVKSTLLAVEDKDKEDKDRWVLITKVENMDRYHSDKGKYELKPALKAFMEKNPASVIAVEEVATQDVEYGDYGMGGSFLTYHVYDGVDVVSKGTRFLYVDGPEHWFVERGKEITITNASDLVIKQRLKEIHVQQERLAAERMKLESELSSLENTMVQPSFGR